VNGGGRALAQDWEVVSSSEGRQPCLPSEGETGLPSERRPDSAAPRVYVNRFLNVTQLEFPVAPLS